MHSWGLSLPPRRAHRGQLSCAWWWGKAAASQPDVGRSGAAASPTSRNAHVIGLQPEESDIKDLKAQVFGTDRAISEFDAGLFPTIILGVKSYTDSLNS